MIKLGEEEEKQYSALAKSLAEFNQTKKEGMESEYESMVSAARDAFTIEYFNTFFMEENITVRRADDKLLSFVCDGNWYQGGAHGMHYLYGYNYDRKTAGIIRCR